MEHTIQPKRNAFSNIYITRIIYMSVPIICSFSHYKYLLMNILDVNMKVYFCGINILRVRQQSAFIFNL